MILYPKELMLDNSNNYGILKTKTVFGYQNHGPSELINAGYNLTEHADPLEWIITPVNLGKIGLHSTMAKSEVKRTQKSLKKIRKRTGKGKKCDLNIMKKDKKMRRRRKGRSKMMKMVIPLLLGLMAAKSILVPVALKTLAFISAKGFLMGFFSTILASILSLKGMFDNSHHYQNRKDEKTQVEIIQVPSPTKEEHYYEDEDPYYRREDLVPLQPISAPGPIVI